MTNNQLLLEALDTPQEFYITDDSKLPYNINAAFEIDGVTYGMSLFQQKFERVYELKMYRVNGSKAYMWKFKNSKHIRQCLSTLLKFAESSLPYVKKHCDGIMIPVPAGYYNKNNKVLNSFINRVVRKSYVQSFRHVPTILHHSNNAVKGYGYYFLVRKPKQLSDLFNAKFLKSYSNFEDAVKEFIQTMYFDSPVMNAKEIDDVIFDAWKIKIDSKKMIDNWGKKDDNTEPEFKILVKKAKNAPQGMPAPALDKLKPTKPQKVKISLKPHPKLQFGGAAAYASPYAEDDSFVDEIINGPVKMVEKEDMHGLPDGLSIDDFEDYTPPPNKAVDKAPPKPENVTARALAFLMREPFKKAATLIAKKGFNDGVFNMSNFEYVWNQSSPSVLQKYYYDTMLDGSEANVKAMLGEYATPFDDEEKKKYTDVFADSLKKLKDWNFHKANSTTVYTPYKKSKNGEYFLATSDDNKNVTHVLNSAGLHLTTLEGGKSNFYRDENFDMSAFEPKTMPGTGKYTFTTHHYGHEIDEDFHAKINHIEGKLGFAYLKNNGVPPGSFNSLKSYTGSNYGVNTVLRESMGSLLSADGEIDWSKVNTLSDENKKHVKSMMKGFESIKPFPEDMVVYRGCSTKPSSADQLMPGNFYVDPGFLSTSIRSTNTFGMQNTKLRILIPKGSKIIPILNESSHASENEVILPAFSLLKIVQYRKINYYSSDRDWETKYKA